MRGWALVAALALAPGAALAEAADRLMAVCAGPEDGVRAWTQGLLAEGWRPTVTDRAAQRRVAAALGLSDAFSITEDPATFDPEALERVQDAVALASLEVRVLALGLDPTAAILVAPDGTVAMLTEFSTASGRLFLTCLAAGPATPMGAQVLASLDGVTFAAGRKAIRLETEADGGLVTYGAVAPDPDLLGEVTEGLAQVLTLDRSIAPADAAD